MDLHGLARVELSGLRHGAIDVLVNLLVGGTVTFTLSATVDPAVQGGTIVNEATVTAPPGTTNPNPGNNTARDTNTVVAEADIAVHKTVNNATPVVGRDGDLHGDGDEQRPECGHRGEAQ